MTRQRPRSLVFITGIAIFLSALFGPTMYRLFSAKEVGQLDFNAMEQQLEDVLVNAFANDSTVLERIQLSPSAIRSESLLTVKSIDRWSLSGQQLAELAHRLRLSNAAATDTIRQPATAIITTDLLSIEPIVGDSQQPMEIQVNRGAYNIASPFTELQRNVVESRDARDAQALIRDGSVAYFDPPQRIIVPQSFPTGWCAAVRWSPGSLGVRCGTATGGLESERYAEFKLLVDSIDNRTMPQLVAPPRKQVYVDGIDVFPDTMAFLPGRIVRSAQLTSAFVGRARTGTIIDEQRKNGRVRLTMTSPRYGPIGLALAGLQRGDERFSTIPLTISPRLTQQLDSVAYNVVERSNQRGRTRQFTVTRAEIVAVDIKTGDILALSTNREPGVGAFLPGTQGQWLGSAVKPMVAAAVLSAHPALATMTVTSGPLATTVDGSQVRRPFDAGCGGGTVDLRRAMRCSSNLFSAELLVRGLRLSGVPRDRDDTARYEQGALATSTVLRAIDDIWKTCGDGTCGIYSTEPWLRDDREGVGALFVKFNGGLLPERSAPRFISTQRIRGVSTLRGPTLDEVVRIAYGQTWNKWTLLDAASVFGSVVTGRDVNQRFLRYSDSTAQGKDFTWRGSAWHRTLLTGLTDVVRHPEGTAGEVAARVERELGRPIRLVGKTGSPTLDDDAFVERNAFVGAISLTAGAIDAPLDDGIAYALFVDYRDPQRVQDRTAASEARRTLRVHRELAAEVAYVIGRYLLTR